MTLDERIDHIVPLRLFDLSQPAGIKEAWSLHNLRPAWPNDNLSKAGKRTHLL